MPTDPRPPGGGHRASSPTAPGGSRRSTSTGRASRCGDRHRARDPQRRRTPRRAWRNCGSRSATSASPTARCRRGASGATPTSISISSTDGKTIATPIVEIKNLNSFRSVERALQYEAERQYEQWKKDGKTIKDAPKQTRGWSDPEGVTKPQREKETAADYRYFPEPDLVPVVVDEAWIARVKASIGELPAERRQAVRVGVRPLGLRRQRPRRAGAGGRRLLRRRGARRPATYKLASNWVQQDILRIAKERKIPLDEFPVGPEALADLINRVGRSELNTNQGREVLGKMIETGEPVEAIIEAGGYRMVSDRDAIVAAVEAALAANPKALEDLKGGKKKPEAVKGFLRGQVMKQTGGKADPALVGELLDAKLAELAG